MANELPKDTESFWHKTSGVENYPKLDKDLNVDVGVIGGGIAGILSAYELAKRGKDVALFEARKLLYGTTGFTTSKLSAQHNLIYDELIKRYGSKKSRSYYDANMEGIEIIKDIAAKHNIDCELNKQDAYVYTSIDSKIDHIEKEAGAYKDLSIDGGLVEDLPVGLDIKKAVVMHNQYEFHPVMFLSGILKELEKMNVHIFESTMITEVNDGNEVLLKTKDGNKIKCKSAICASHYPVDDPDKFYTDMEPEISFATIYELKDDYPGGMYISYDNPRRTFRGVSVDDKKYILVGGESYRLGTGTSDMERYESIVDFSNEIFGVKDVVARWSSHDYLTKDRMPFVGLSDPDRKNVYVVTGLSKWGLANAAISSKILSDMIEEKENPYIELFNPHREIPEIKELEQEEDRRKRRKSTSKRQVDDLEKDEALVYEKGDKKFGVYRDKDNNIHHLDLECTHLGCNLGWNDGDKTWDCKCHGSRFNARGEVIEGPALKSLKIISKKEKK